MNDENKSCASPAPSAKQEPKLAGFQYRPDLSIRAVLYTDSINGAQVCRDDLWLATTADLNTLAQGPEPITEAATSASASPAAGKLTQAEASKVLDLALDLEKTGRICSLSDGQERSDFVARNRAIQTELQDLLRSFTEPTSAGAAPVAGSQQVPEGWEIEFGERCVHVSSPCGCITAAYYTLNSSVAEIVLYKLCKALLAAAPAVPVPVHTQGDTK